MISSWKAALSKRVANKQIKIISACLDSKVALKSIADGHPPRRNIFYYLLPKIVNLQSSGGVYNKTRCS